MAAEGSQPTPRHEMVEAIHDVMFGDDEAGGSQPSGPTPLECLEAMIYLADIGETPAKVTVNLYREVAKRAKGDRP